MGVAGHGWSIPVRTIGVTHVRLTADTDVVDVDNVDRRLVRLFEASQAHERAPTGVRLRRRAGAGEHQHSAREQLQQRDADRADHVA